MAVQVRVSDYRRFMGGTKENHAKYSKTVKDILLSKLSFIKEEKIDIFDLGGEYHNHNAGKPNHLVVYINGTDVNANVDISNSEPIIINDYIYDIHPSILKTNGNYQTILSSNNVPLAQYTDARNEVNIIFDLFMEYSDDRIKIFEYIVDEIAKIKYLEKMKNSWKNSANKEGLINEIKVTTESISTRIINDLRDREISHKNNVEDYRRRLKVELDRLRSVMVQLANTEDDKDILAKKIVADLDLIISNDLIEDVLFENRRFKVFTKELVITDDKDRRFKGGQFEITIDMRDTIVKFKGTEKRRGYWSPQDPHPHISADGTACLGSIQSTVAELCSQNELYALVLVLLDFLQSANISDPAGRKVENWQRLNDDGTIYEEPKVKCQCCSREFEENRLSNVYEEIDIDEDGELYENIQNRVCEDCRDDYYHYDEDVDAYISDDFDYNTIREE